MQHEIFVEVVEQPKKLAEWDEHDEFFEEYFVDLDFFQKMTPMTLNSLRSAKKSS